MAFEEGGHTVVGDQREDPGIALADVVEQPIRRTYLAELHCVLLRRATLERVGLFDEGMTTRELTDWTLRALAAGEDVWLAPSCVVTHLPALRLRPTDAPYFILRWSENWTARTFDRFASVHGVRIAEQHRQWVRFHRMEGFSMLFGALERVFGQRLANAFRSRVFWPAEVVVNRAIVSTWRRLDHRIW
jgi:GT2 family glycosyltransferase